MGGMKGEDPGDILHHQIPVVTLQIRALPSPQLEQPPVLVVPSRQADPLKGSVGARAEVG